MDRWREGGHRTGVKKANNPTKKRILLKKTENTLIVESDLTKVRLALLKLKHDIHLQFENSGNVAALVSL